MKKILLALLIICLVMTFACKKAEGATLIDPSLGWIPQVTTPMDVMIDGHWFINAKDGEPRFAMGPSTCPLRLAIPAITFATLDFNVMVAKTFDVERDPMYGIGFKGNVTAFKINVTDNMEVFPSLGVGLMNDFQNMDNFSDLIDKFRVTVYGTLLLYKWN